MLSVNEAACIVPGVRERRPGLHNELQGSSSSAGALAFLPPCNRKVRSHAHFQLRLRFLGQRKKGGGVHRKTLSGSGSSFYCNLCKCCALIFTPDIQLLCSGCNMTDISNCQPSTSLFLHTVFSKIMQCKMKKQCVYSAHVKSSSVNLSYKIDYCYEVFFCFFYLAAGDIAAGIT